MRRLDGGRCVREPALRHQRPPRLAAHDTDLGIVTPDQRIITGYMDTPNGPQLNAVVVDKDDPRAKALEAKGQVMDGKKNTEQ